MFGSIANEEEKEALKKKYICLKKADKKTKDFFLLKKNKWSFLLPCDEEQEKVIKKFTMLLKREIFEPYITNIVSYEDSCVYVTEIRSNRINIYVTTKNLLSELCDEIKEKVSDESISFLIFKKKYSHKNKLYELRVGAYGIPCYKLTKCLFV